MRFVADLHLHSKYSRATSRNCDLENLSLWARKKGIAVLGTGDFTHPAWRADLRDQLVPAEPGLFRLRPELERAVSEQPQAGVHTPTRFALQVEISTIYKRGERTRKVHHLIYVPDFDAMDTLVKSLDRIGNLRSDGRPILGLDSRHLLELTLGCSDDAYLVPAHIWTPWFAVLGSKSGFDSIDECYGDLSDQIFAVETGLSSDPAMNWRVSALDRFALMSNSDAHSPSKLGREACLFETELSYYAMRDALRTRQGFAGTIEFFPEEGKYHLDGHRKCGLRVDPGQATPTEGLCPRCGKPLTVGVMRRVEALADRDEGERPSHADPFRSFLPLAEIIGEIHGVGPNTKTVERVYEKLIQQLGPELHILAEVPVEDIRRQGSALIAEAIDRMRSGRVTKVGGYDGAYGVVRVFEPGELAGTAKTQQLFAASESAAPAQGGKVGERSALRASEQAPPTPSAAQPPREPSPAEASEDTGRDMKRSSLLEGLDEFQCEAATTTEGPLLILAGPGTGKTRTLTHRMAHLMCDLAVAPESILALTFTTRAAQEMRDRLRVLAPQRHQGTTVTTFHGLGWQILREHGRTLGLPADLAIADERTQQEVLADSLSLTLTKASALAERLRRAQRGTRDLGSELADAQAAYQRTLRSRGLVDFDDLIRLPVQLLQFDAGLAESYRRRFQFVSIDEYQDIDAQQYQLVKLLAPPSADPDSSPQSHICAIGDPDQAIYSFRGADVGFFLRFRRDFPRAKVVQLEQGYRCDRPILDASLQVVSRSRLVRQRQLRALTDSSRRVVVHEAPSDRAEAEFVVKSIEELIGGHSFFSLDTGRSDGPSDTCLGFADFAVLYRTEAQGDVIAEALDRAGMPIQRRTHRRMVEGRLLQWLRHELTRASAQESPPLMEGLGRLLTNPRDWPAAGPDPASNEGGRGEQDAGRSDVEALVPWLMNLAEQCQGDVSRFLAEVALGVDMDSWDPRADHVSLLTLHASKGLEFPVVFVVGCEDGLLPLRWARLEEGELGGGAIDDGAIDEERRLFFVGMTRARQALFISHARQRMWRGKLVERSPSPFVGDIATDLQERRDSARPRRRHRSKSTQLPLF